MTGIYKITNIITNKSYVGQSVHIERRWQEHCSKSAHSLIGKSIQKYGKTNFIFQVLEECPIELLNQREEYYIHLYNTVVPNGYNILDYNNGEITSSLSGLESVKDIIYDIEESSLTLEEIAEKYNLSNRTIIRINQGDTHLFPNKTYPLRARVVVPDSYCVDCGIKITKGAVRCCSCMHKSQRKVDRPTREELKNMIRSSTFVDIGYKYDVSDNTIRKWCKGYNLPARSSDIKKISDDEWSML